MKRMLSLLLSLLVLAGALTACKSAPAEPSSVPVADDPADAELTRAKQELLELVRYLSYDTKKYAIGIHTYGGVDVADRVKTYETRLGVMPAYIDFDMNALPFRTPEQITGACNDLIDFVGQGGFIALTDHWLVPTKKIAESQAGGANNARFPLTLQQFHDVMTPGTDLYRNFTEELDIKVAFVKRLQEKNIAVIYRPLHEMNGTGWFWWCRNPEQGVTSQDTAALFRFVHDYFESHGAKNILWEFCTAMAGDWGDACYDCYPGEDYVDILGTDWYLPSGNYAEAAKTLTEHFGKKPMVIAEFGGDGSYNAKEIPLQKTQFYIDGNVVYDVPMGFTGFYFDLIEGVDYTPSALSITLADLPEYWEKVR